ncbi:MAG: EpsI family protein [Syntrophotaleaceae bacterium]
MNVLQIKILIACLCLTGVLVYLRPEFQAGVPKTSLIQSLAVIPNWQRTSVSALDPILIQELQLDDYVFQSYSQGKRKVFLYIGLYYSSAKVGASHDPLVCFPGQGWQVSEVKKGHFLISGDPEFEVRFSQLQAKKNTERELVYYWYQAGRGSTSGPLAQKLMLLHSKIMHRAERNAFVRVSTSLGDETLTEGQKSLTSFIQDFYPVFVKHLESI